MRIWTARPGIVGDPEVATDRHRFAVRVEPDRGDTVGDDAVVLACQRAGQPTRSQLGGSDTTATAALIAAPHQARDIAPRDVAQPSAFEHPVLVSPQRNQDEGGAARRLAQQARIVLPGLGAEATRGLAHLRVVVSGLPLTQDAERLQLRRERLGHARLRRRGAHRTFRAVVVHTRERPAHNGQADGDRRDRGDEHGRPWQ